MTELRLRRKERSLCRIELVRSWKLRVSIVNWRHVLEHKWNALRLGEVQVESDDEQHVFEVQVYLDDLAVESVRVELYANGVDADGPERVQMECARQLVGAMSGYVYRASVSAARPATDYTVRLIPRHDGVAIPLEDAHVLWQR